MKAALAQRRLRLVPPAPDSRSAPAEARGTPLSTPPPGLEPEAPIESPVRSRAITLASLADADLVALAAEGKSAAFEVLYRRYAAFAIHLATRIHGSVRDVEDIVHDAFVSAFERLRDLHDPSAFKGWLGAIVVHAVRTRMRRAKLMDALGIGPRGDTVDIDAVASPEASPAVRAQVAQIYALLKMVPTDDRIAWTLRSVEGHDLETVARLTDCSLATVKRRIVRTQRFLDDHFVEPHLEEVSP